MRASVDQSDPGYNPAHFGAKVFFEGAQISHVITADEEKRFVIVHCTDERGNVMLTADRTETKTETRYGAVRIELPATPYVPRTFE
jgi:hypothetical protein